MKKLKIILVALNIIFFALIFYNFKNDKVIKLSNFDTITDLNNAHKIEISELNNTIVLDKKEYNWEIATPINWKVDKYTISNFKTIFSHLVFSEMFTIEDIRNRGEIIDDYGIIESSPKIVIYHSKEKSTIKIGNPTRDKKFVYCMIKNSVDANEKIWRVSEEITNLTSIPFKDWADSTLIRCGLYQIDDISVSFKSNNNSTTTTTLTKTKNQWHFNEPFKAKANNDEVRFLVNNILSEQIMDFSEKSNDHNKSDEKWILNFIINRSGEKHEFKFSDSVSNDSYQYRLCKSSYSPHILKIKESFLSNFSNWSTKLRERKIFQIEIDKLDKILINNKNNDFQITKQNNDDWLIKIDNQKSILGDNDNVKDLIQKLNAIEIKEFLSFNPTQTELKTLNESSVNYMIQTHSKDTTVRTVLINKNKLNASIWKTFIVEDSLLCLVDEYLNDIITLMVYELKNRSIIEDRTLRNLVLSEVDSNKTLLQLDDNITQKLCREFEILKVQSFINNDGKVDGTWNDGDWVPWRYKFSFNVPDDNFSLKDQITIMTSDILNSNKLIGKFQDSNLTFNLPTNLINLIQKLQNESYSSEKVEAK